MLLFTRRKMRPPAPLPVIPTTVLTLFSTTTPSPTHSKTAAVVSVLKFHGFMDPQIQKLISKYPRVLNVRLPLLTSKLDFFRSKGFAGPTIGDLFSKDPQLLRVSLANRIAPNFDVLLPILGGQKPVLAAVSKVPRLLMNDVSTTFLPNLEILTRHFMLRAGAALDSFVASNPRLLFQRPHRLEDAVNQLREMGYDLHSKMALTALSVLASTSVSTWERKSRLYKNLGFSEDDVQVAFRKNPMFILVSDSKIRERVEFYKTKFNWTPAAIAAHPIVLMLSLEKRIKPRCAVFGLLMSKGVVTTKVPEVHVLSYAEKEFYKCYVERYKDEVPEVVDAYQGDGVEFIGFEMERFRQPNLDFLKKHNVPESSIRKLEKRPKVLLVNSQKFRGIFVGLQKNMGFDIQCGKFVDALSVLATMPESNSTAKLSLYKNLGWSADDYRTAFKKQPYFVTVPDDQIKKIVRFYQNKLNWRVQDIAKCPNLFLLSLEKSVLRSTIFEMLVIKGVIRRQRPGDALFTMTENAFLKAYVDKYNNEFPEILKAYKIKEKLEDSA